MVKLIIKKPGAKIKQIRFKGEPFLNFGLIIPII